MWLTPTEMMKDIWYVNPLARFPDFLLGMVMYVIFKSSDSAQRCRATDTVPAASSSRMATFKEVAAVAIFIVFYLFSVHVPQVYRYSCYYWLPVALVIFTFARQGGLLSRILSSRPLVWGGEISFGFYLIHHLLFRLFTEAERHLQFTLSPYIAILLLLATTVIISGVSYRWFEQSVGKWIKRLLA
jgi:peptidoglycan/LPS O-acetylase OafA/YrhL